MKTNRKESDGSSCICPSMMRMRSLIRRTWTLPLDDFGTWSRVPLSPRLIKRQAQNYLLCQRPELINSGIKKIVLICLFSFLHVQRPKLDHGLVPHPPVKHHYVQRVSMNLYEDDDLPPDQSVATPFFTSLSSKLGLPVPNPAPDIEEEALKPPVHVPPQPTVYATRPPPESSNEPKKKKYAKEAWPGKKHGSNLLV